MTKRCSSQIPQIHWKIERNSCYVNPCGLITTTLSVQRIIEPVRHGDRAGLLTVFLRERGWKCKALHSHLEHLCVFQTTNNLPGENLVVEVCCYSTTPKKSGKFICKLAFIICTILGIRSHLCC